MAHARDKGGTLYSWGHEVSAYPQEGLPGRFAVAGGPEPVRRSTKRDTATWPAKWPEPKDLGDVPGMWKARRPVAANLFTIMLCTG